MLILTECARACVLCVRMNEATATGATSGGEMEMGNTYLSTYLP